MHIVFKTIPRTFKTNTSCQRLGHLRKTVIGACKTVRGCVSNQYANKILQHKCKSEFIQLHKDLASSKLRKL